MNIEILIIIAIIIALGVIAGFGILVSRIFRRKTISSASNLKISFSSEETLSQLFFLLSVFFLAITAISFSRNLGNVIEWPLVILSSSFISIFLSYRFKGVLLLPVGLIGLFSWWFLKASEWISFESSIDMDIKDLSLFSLPLLFSLFLYVVGSMHGQNRKFERYAAIYNVLPVIAITVALFFVSTELGIEALEEMTEGSDIFNSWQLSLSYILGGVIFIVGVFYSLGKNIVRPIEGVVLFVYGSIFGLSVFLPDISEGRQNLYLAAFFNIFLLIHLVVMLFTGYLKKKDWFINLGSFSLFVFIIVKYFDWAFDFLDKSIFFISAGILLLVLGWFMEKGRRYMLSSSRVAV